MEWGIGLLTNFRMGACCRTSGSSPLSPGTTIIKGKGKGKGTRKPPKAKRSIGEGSARSS
jgi:hypothetical protein